MTGGGPAWLVGLQGPSHPKQEKSFLGPPKKLGPPRSAKERGPSCPGILEYTFAPSGLICVLFSSSGKLYYYPKSAKKESENRGGDHTEYARLPRERGRFHRRAAMSPMLRRPEFSTSLYEHRRQTRESGSPTDGERPPQETAWAEFMIKRRKWTADRFGFIGGQPERQNNRPSAPAWDERHRSKSKTERSKIAAEQIALFANPSLSATPHTGGPQWFSWSGLGSHDLKGAARSPGSTLVPARTFYLSAGLEMAAGRQDLERTTAGSRNHRRKNWIWLVCRFD